jgi:hypothetical protein
MNGITTQSLNTGESRNRGQVAAANVDDLTVHDTVEANMIPNIVSTLDFFPS